MTLLVSIFFDEIFFEEIVSQYNILRLYIINRHIKKSIGSILD